MKTTRQIYCQYLLSSQINYTGTNLADHVDGLDHNSVYRFLKHEKLTPSLVWEKVHPLLVQSEDGYLLLDDTVLDKSSSHEIRGVRRQYSGNAHGVIKSIGVVTPIKPQPRLLQPAHRPILGTGLSYWIIASLIPTVTVRVRSIMSTTCWTWPPSGASPTGPS